MLLFLRNILNPTFHPDMKENQSVLLPAHGGDLCRVELESQPKVRILVFF